jgi:hypothetical protein
MHVSSVGNILGELARGGFIKRAERGRYTAQTDAEPQMGAAS